MKKKYYLEGMLGLLSLLGFVGVFTEERMFLAFFAFACNFQYFFIPADEMMTAYMNKSAAPGFLRRYVPDRGGDTGLHPGEAARRQGPFVRHPGGMGGRGGGAVVVRLVLQVPGKLGRPMIL